MSAHWRVWLLGGRWRGAKVALAALLAGIGVAACGGKHGEAAVKQAAYDQSKEICSKSSPREIANAQGGNPSDLHSVAAAYAKGFYKPKYRADSKRGCLAGLRKR